MFRNYEQAEKLRDTTVMFSSNHDTEPALLEHSVMAIHKLLKQNNHVTWVTKPHLDCVERICKEFSPQDRFTFMPTITAFDSTLLKFWEPFAPDFDERLACLKHAHAAGFHTSVICEPMLDAENIVELYERLVPYVTDEILVGPMNQMSTVKKRNAGMPGFDKSIERIEAWQTKESLWTIHGWLSGRPKVKFKDDYRKTLGLPPNGEPASTDVQPAPTGLPLASITGLTAEPICV